MFLLLSFDFERNTAFLSRKVINLTMMAHGLLDLVFDLAFHEGPSR